MSRHILFFTLCLGLIQAAFARSAADDDREIRRVEAELCHAYQAGDGAVLRRDLDETFTLTNSRGEVSNYAQNIAEVEKREPHYDVFRNYNQKVRLYGDAAIVIGVTAVEGTADGKPFAADFQFTDTYIHRDQRWLLAASHASRLPDAKAKADANPTYLLPLDASLVDTAGRKLYVDDAAIRATVPALKDAGPRHTTCANSMYAPPMLWIKFRPTVTDEHRATMHVLECKFAGREELSDLHGSVECSAPQSADYAGFDDNPDYYFVAPWDVDPNEALELFRALRGGKLKLPEHVKAPDFNALHSVSIYKNEGQLRVSWGDCGCTQTIIVHVQRDKNGTRFTAAQGGSRCV